MINKLLPLLILITVSCSTQKENPSFTKEEGMDLVLKTKSALGKELMKAIQDKGVEDALVYCNLKALPITDSVARSSKLSIKRVSDKNRNPENIANEDELIYIKEAKELLARGENVSPKIFVKEEKTKAYYPIMTNGLCLKCHGVPEKDIEPSVLSKINELYPQDLAQGYALNQIRGIWVVENE